MSETSSDSARIHIAPRRHARICGYVRAHLAPSRECRRGSGLHLSHLNEAVARESKTHLSGLGARPR